MSGRGVPRVHAVILAGGAGERFWPASRRHFPKPLLEVAGGKSLLDATVARAHRFAGPDRVWLVCGSEHASAMRRASGLPASRVLVEPRRRNTAMAVAWAAVRLAAEDPEAVMAVLPADHHIPDAAAFARDIRAAARAARDGSSLVTFGVKPTRPEVGYGYIRLGKRVGAGHARLREVQRFVEKPDLATARRYLRHGGYRWNAGVFVWSAATLLEEVAACAPDVYRALEPLRGRPRGRNREAVEKAYRKAPSLPIDIAVMERSQRVWCLPVDFAWSDVGTWASLAEDLGVGEPVGRGQHAARSNRVIAGDVLSEDSEANLIWGGDRLVALLGVEGLAIVDSDDVLLITRLDRSADVRRFVALLKKRGRSGLT